uniref:Opioid related nociceptin receptor 1 n=1 Tax=Myotis myotis TaxID=51298 RepID=A0A7J7W045_MYOMY|nr:opioid related nociceptin receptor 1 [Myotis myotis]
MECLFPTPPGEVYSSDLQDGLVSPNHSLLPPDLLLNVSHGAFLPLGLKVTIVGLYLAVCVGGLLGNCLVMYVILREEGRGTESQKHQPAASCTSRTGDVPATKAHTLDWNRTWDPQSSGQCSIH